MRWGYFISSRQRAGNPPHGQKTFEAVLLTAKLNDVTKPIKPELSATKFQADVHVKPVNNGHSASVFRKEDFLHRQRKIEIPDPQQCREALNINDISHILMHMASGDKVQ